MANGWRFASRLVCRMRHESERHSTISSITSPPYLLIPGLHIETLSAPWSCVRRLKTNNGWLIDGWIVRTCSFPVAPSIIFHMFFFLMIYLTMSQSDIDLCGPITIAFQSENIPAFLNGSLYLWYHGLAPFSIRHAIVFIFSVLW